MMMHPLKFTFGWVVLAFLLSSCQKDTTEIQTASEFSNYLQKERQDQNIPALAVVVCNSGEVVSEQYHGFANVETEEVLGSNHLFLLASVSKVVTATALLQLMEEGQFELDDPINDHLDFEVNHPDYGTDITFRMLLTHTSGIADGPALDDQYYNGKDSPVSLESFMREYLVPGGAHYDYEQNFHGFEPGTEHEYSNVGSALIGVLVEEISGESFRSYCRQHIFEPLEMENTYWSLDAAIQAGASIAHPHEYNRGAYEVLEHYTFTDYPNGGLRSTAEDLSRLLRAIAMDGNLEGAQVLLSSTVAEMETRQIPSIDDEVGLHLFEMDAELGLWGHDGGEKGVTTIMAYHPETKVSALVLCNEGNAELEEILQVAYEFGRDR